MIRFAKGHGTENDFVVLPDPDGALDLTAARVAALCDRRRGLGADGVLRVVRWAALKDDAFPAEPGVEWFMDYRNADGGLAEMCGNGVRVYARWLADAGWLPEGPSAPLRLGTRAGVREVRFTDADGDGDVAVDMGPARLGPQSAATVDGHDFPGTAVDVGNPHLACVTDAALDALDLTAQPGYDTALFPHGVNVEFVSPLRGGAGGDARARARRGGDPLVRHRDRGRRGRRPARRGPGDRRRRGPHARRPAAGRRRRVDDRARRALR